MAPIPVKLEALEVIALAKIGHQFANTRIAEEKILELDKALIKCLRRIFGIGDTITIKARYQPKVKGIFGVRLPSIVYHTSRIAHLISMLDHKEENIRFVARNSLELDMHKRNISRVYHGRNCLGFEMKNDGKFSTKVKGGFGVATDWPHLNLLACKVGTELIWEKPNAKDLMEAGKSMIFINGELFEYHTKRQLRIKMQSLQLDKEMNTLTELKMQGTLVNLPFLDYLLSQDIFKNVLFPDKLISFWYKMWHNLLLCNLTLLKWYGTDPRCKIDGYHIESMAHLFKRCKEFKKNY